MVLLGILVDYIETLQLLVQVAAFQADLLGRARDVGVVLGELVVQVFTLEAPPGLLEIVDPVGGQGVFAGGESRSVALAEELGDEVEQFLSAPLKPLLSRVGASAADAANIPGLVRLGKD